MKIPNLTLALVMSISISTLPTGIALAAETKTGADAFGDWKSDSPGTKRLIKATDLPEPQAQDISVSNSADHVDMPAGAKPKVPSGFTIKLIVSGLENPRVIRRAPNGDLFVAESKADRVRVLRMTDDGTEVTKNEIFVSHGLHQPYGIAFYPPGPDPKWIYIANSNSIVRFPYENGNLKAEGKPQIIVDNIPSAHHWTRDIVFTPDGKTLYLAVGSGSNVAMDMSPKPYEGMETFNKTHPLGATWDTEDHRADILTFDPEGNRGKIFATGLRNCSGMAIHPETKKPWCVVNERDELGDNLPFEYATEVNEGKFYGWPWYYIGNHEDPRKKGERPDLASQVTVPDVLFQAHSAPLGIAFYDGKNFPVEYRGDAFVTFHGSWNRGSRTGYKVVRVLFKDGKPTGEYEDFITGFVVSDKEVWGRPVGVAVGDDGSLYITEDGSGTIWRVTHQG